MKKWFLKFTLYVVILLGFVFLHILNIEELIYDQKDVQVKSKIDFVYQQF